MPLSSISQTQHSSSLNTDNQKTTLSGIRWVGLFNEQNAYAYTFVREHLEKQQLTSSVK